MTQLFEKLHYVSFQIKVTGINGFYRDDKVEILYLAIDDEENKLAELSGQFRQLFGDSSAAKYPFFTPHITLCNHLEPSYSAADALVPYHFGRLFSLEVNQVDLCDSSAFNSLSFTDGFL